MACHYINSHKTPIVIGGQGGSGTRVVAEILMRANVYLGYDLNRSNDDLTFTFFFKLPRIFCHYYDRVHPIHRRLLSLHEKILFGENYSPIEIILLLQAGWRHLFAPYYGKRWIVHRLLQMIRPPSPPTPVSHFWGWKEPHTLFHLHGIRVHYPDARYVLLIRNGLDMAYSSNQQQMHQWATCLGINSDNFNPRSRFDFWYRLNTFALSSAQNLFGDHFHGIWYQDLCLHPKREITNLLDFVGVNLDNVPETIWDIPHLSRSYGRHKNFNTEWITEEVLRKQAKIREGIKH